MSDRSSGNGGGSFEVRVLKRIVPSNECSSNRQGMVQEEQQANDLPDHAEQDKGMHLAPSASGDGLKVRILYKIFLSILKA